MKVFSRASFVSACAFLAASCTLLLDLPSQQCETNADCTIVGGNSVCDVVQSVCVVPPPQLGRSVDASMESGDSPPGAPSTADAREPPCPDASAAACGAAGGDSGLSGAGASNDVGAETERGGIEAELIGEAGSGLCDADTPACVVDGSADGDHCPTDPAKTEPGLCGCGHQDPPDGSTQAAFCFKEAIVHRYSFGGTGAVATDSIGGANGAIGGGTAAVQAGGAVTLAGDRDAARYAGEGFVALPSHLLSVLASATIEAWITWRGAAAVGGSARQRIFDMGDQLGAVGRTYLNLSPSAVLPGGPMRTALTLDGAAGETAVVATTGPLPTGVLKHVAVVIDDPNRSLALYLDGAAVGSAAISAPLSSINDVNCWLGRSQFATGPEYNGMLHEFRIYNIALSATQVQASFAAGIGPSYLP